MKVYLGDGAYATFDGAEVVLTAENGIEATDRVVLGSYELRALIRFLREQLHPVGYRWILDQEGEETV